MDRDGSWDLLGVTAAAFFVTMAARLAPSPLVPDVATAFGVSKSAVGIAPTGTWAAYALFQFPGGVIADRLGERTVNLLAIGLTGHDAALAASLLSGSAGFVLFLVAEEPAALVGGTVLVGVGLSWPGVVNSRFMDDLAPDERGTGFGLVRTLVLFVSSLGSDVTGTLADRIGWSASYGLVAGLLLLLVALLVANRAFGADA